MEQRQLIAMVAVDLQWGIGFQGDQMVYLSQDLKHFKETTQGHTVIVGRKTLATFPQGKPLKNRRNLIFSREVGWTVEGAEVVHSLEELWGTLQPEELAFVIGGEEIYRLLLPYCYKAYVTQLEASFPADTYFPNLIDLPHWIEVSRSSPQEEAGIGFSFVEYAQRKVFPKGNL